MNRLFVSVAIYDVIKTLHTVGSVSQPIQQGAMLTKCNKMRSMMAYEILKALSLCYL